MSSLRQFVRSVLIEGMRTIDDAQAVGLALFAGQEANAYQFILYDPGPLEAALEQLIKDVGPMNIDVSVVTDALEETDGIVGFIEIGMTDDPCYDAAQVNMVAAKQGWGPLMYDIAMSASREGLTADRENVSTDAERIWKQYATSRGDVSRLPFDDINDPKTPPPEDDCTLHPGRPDLNFAYKGSKVNISELKGNHIDFMRNVNVILRRSKVTQPVDIVTALKVAGQDYFAFRHLQGRMLPPMNNPIDPV
jgi:hypothetical protein